MSIEQREEERRYRESAADEAKTLDSRVLEDPVRVLNPRPAVMVAPSDSVATVVERMAAEGQGCALVVENDRVAGIFTERDLVTRVDSTSRNGPVGDVMTPEPDCLTLDDTLGYALHMMAVGGFRSVPVVDEAGRPIGVVTQQDGVRYLVGFFPEEILNQPPRSIEQQPPRSQYGG